MKSKLLDLINSTSVKLVGVSKRQPVTSIQNLYHQGLKRFGENYLQEALPKIEALQHLAIEWHFIGQIQSRKCKDIAQHFSWVQSVDRIKIAKKLSDHRIALKMSPLNICVQVNIDKEPSKAGVMPETLSAFIDSIKDYPGLKVRGLMIFPNPSINANGDSFVRAQQLFAALKTEYSDLDTLSMGTSNDHELAIQHGATMLRLGQMLF